MSERDRPSLTGLAIKKPLLERGKPVVSLDAAESSLLGEPTPPPPPVQAAAAAAAAPPKPAAPAPEPVAAPPAKPPVPQSVHTAVQSTVLSLSRLQPKKKEIKIAWTFKIPYALHQELAAVAAHNDLTMSDIVIEAIQLHLPNFAHPRSKL